jgi:hypothetical protein
MQLPDKNDDSWLQARRLTGLGRPNARRHEFLRLSSQIPDGQGPCSWSHGQAHLAIIEANDVILDCKPVVLLVYILK